MKTRLILVVTGLAMAASANPYGTIATRNAFNLLPPRVETSKPGDVFKPSPEYKLTGIAGFGSNKWALLSKADPGKAPVHFMLREGQREGPLEVVSVDEIANLVRIRNDGTLVELTFGTNAPPQIDLVTKRFVDEHTRAHELHQQREAARVARERAEFIRQVGLAVPSEPTPPEQAIAESQ
jgi:hypothetical protein